MDDIKKAKRKAYNKKWRSDNKDHNTAVYKKWYEANKEREAARKKKWYLKNKEHHIANTKKWNDDNKAYKAFLDAKRRAARFRATVYMSPEMKLKVTEVYQIAQEASITTGYDWHVDHIVPLSKGGLHTLNNLQVVPATWNLEKNNNNCDRYWD